LKAAVFHREATAELDEAIARYENQRPGLGLDFLLSIEQATLRIQRNPSAFPLHENTTLRRYVLMRFPYSIFYQEMPDCIWIAAIAHQKRRPGYWKSRVMEE
jgi:hypothetical protein